MKILTVCVLVGATMLLVDAGDKTCPPGWRLIHKRCYRFVDKLMTWSDAEKYCMSLEAHLASVHSLPEYNQVQKLILDAAKKQKPTWIGGYNEQQRNMWFWSDGSKFHYSDWCKGEPTEGAQYCIQMNFSDKRCLDNVQCYILLPSVCKMGSR